MQDDNFLRNEEDIIYINDKAIENEILHLQVLMILWLRMQEIFMVVN